MAPVVVGLSGVTNGGKTTLTDKIKASHSNVTVLNMDDYYWLDDDEHHILLPEFNNYANWEVLSSVDFKRMTEDVQNWKDKVKQTQSDELLLIEGILILNYRKMAALCDLKFFITLEKEECWNRRRLREYLPPEPAGYFEAICWPEYLRNKQDLLDQQDIVYVDGQVGKEELFNKIYSDILAAEKGKK